MTITSLVLFPLISVLIRNEILDFIGSKEAGYWEAMRRISDNYLVFASSLVMYTVIPKLAENQSHEGRFHRRHLLQTA